ncbi:hypothetical protein B0J18DRAFT_130431 [Chaetomium sp. MPI-SDFR-AT-0129]|nr:hypothetical protein B0J18DRAFT_130431 [Chaetomium sp. MPI-SDFR-AT-0129]
MGPRAVQFSAQTLRRRVLAHYQSSLLLLHPHPRPQNSPQSATPRSHRFASLSSVSAPTSVSSIGQQPVPKGVQLKSSLGNCYVIDEVLSQRPAAGRIWCVYRATHEGKQFILKDIIPGDFDYVIPIYKQVEQSPHIRTAVDSIPERHILVFPYLEKGLLHVDITALSSISKKVIIRDALTGLADYTVNISSILVSFPFASL